MMNAVERDLAQQERPVGREDLVDLPLHSRGEVIARVHRLRLVGEPAFCTAHDRRSQKAGPRGSMKSPLATRKPSSFTVIGNCGSARAAGPKIGLHHCSDVELRLVAGAEDAVGLLLVQRGRAAEVGADLRVGEVVAVVEALLALALDHLLGVLGAQADQHDRVADAAQRLEQRVARRRGRPPGTGRPSPSSRRRDPPGARARCLPGGRCRGARRWSRPGSSGSSPTPTAATRRPSPTGS